MNTFYRTLVILRIVLASCQGPTSGEPELDEQCESEACKDQQESPGHALLSTRSVLYRTTSETFVEKTAAARQETQGSVAVASVTHQNLTNEIVELSVDLSGEQKQRMLDLMQTLRKEITLLSVNATQPSDDPPIMASHLPGEIEPTIGVEAEQEDKTRMLAKFFVVPISIVFFIVYNVSTMMEKLEITAIPESGIVIAIGVLLGCFMKKYTQMDFFEDDESWAELNSAMLNLMLLPIIIFASGWTLRRQDFFSQMPYILLFAVVGTLISTSVVAGLIVMTGRMALHNVTRWRTAFAYASLISATDPVATLSTYTKLRVHPLLNIMVFGEATINDAVAIVLFKVFNSNANFLDPATGIELYIGPRLLTNIGWGVFKSFFGSLVMGVGLGMFYTLIAREMDMRQNKKGQILVIFASIYLTYAAAESVGLSGIIAEIFCSLVMGVYMRPHLSTDGCALATFFMEQIATLADSAVFLLVGVSVVQLTTKGWFIGLWIILFCLIGRFCSVVPIACIVNSLKAARGAATGIEREGWNTLTPQHVFMIWHSGLRGGIALALAWELGNWVDEAEGAGTKKALQTATFLVILVFLIVFGGSTSFCLKYLGIPIGTDEAEDVLSKTESTGEGHGFLVALDKKILSPLLIGDQA